MNFLILPAGAARRLVVFTSIPIIPCGPRTPATRSRAGLRRARGKDHAHVSTPVALDYRSHSLPFLPVIEWTFIYLPILFHTAYGIWITVTGQPNADRYPYRKNQFYVAQRISAIVIVFFMLFHVLSLKYGWLGTNYRFEPHRALGTVARHFDHWWVWPVYLIGIVASCYHLANGFWTAAITWGVTISAESRRRFGLVCTGLFVLLTIAGLLA